MHKRLQYFDNREFDDNNSHLMATCVVTDRAKSKRISLAKKILDQGMHLYLTGCGAFEKGEAMDYRKFFELYPELLVYKDKLTLLGEDPDGQTDLGAIGEYDLNKEVTLTPTSPPSSKGDGLEENPISSEYVGGELYTKKFIVIQSGCDSYCTFCLTIYRRGNHRNRDIESIINEIQSFVDSGGKEIVITGVNLAAWGASNTRKPSESKFSYLLENILKRTTVERIRISSIGPEFVDDHFYDLMHDSRFTPHFHLSIQSFSTPVLQRMNRNYDQDLLNDVISKLHGLNRPDAEYISIGADIIVGFPGETEKDFTTTLDSLGTCGITKLHAFPFSPHQKGESVPAGKLTGQLPIEIKKDRMKQILARGNEVRSQFVELNKGIQWPVLLEGKKNGARTGRTPNYIQRNISGNYQRGDIVMI